MGKFGTYSEETAPTSDDIVLIKEQTSGSIKRVQLGNVLPAGSVTTAKLAALSVTNDKRLNGCMFGAYKTGATYNLGAGDNIQIYDTKVYDLGNNYNSANGRFTAPVNGVYHFDCRHRSAIIGANRRCILNVKINGSFYHTGSDQVQNSGFFSPLYSGDIKLNAGDYVEMNIYMDNTQGWNTGTTDAYWSGRLVSRV